MGFPVYLCLFCRNARGMAKTGVVRNFVWTKEKISPAFASGSTFNKRFDSSPLVFDPVGGLLLERTASLL